MPTSYPDDLDTEGDLPSDRADDTLAAGIHASDHNNLADAVRAIEEELGARPSGPSATVAAAIEELRTLSQAVESTRLDPVTWTSGAATAGKCNNVDATAGPKTVALPTGIAAGIPIAVQKTDASTNGINITGTIRGVAASTLPIRGNRYETQVLVSEGSNSWRPLTDHKTWASIDADVATIGDARYPAIARMDATESGSRLLASGLLDSIIVGAITRDSNDAATSASVVWPDGATGTYTATTVSTAFPGAVDAYTVTHVLSGTTLTFTQPLVTRNVNGAVTNRPAITVA